MKVISDWKEIKTTNEKCDYYGFPLNIFTFGYSMKNSKLVVEDDVYYRIRNHDATIIYSDNPIDYTDSFDYLQSIGISKVKRLPSLTKNDGDDKSVKCWFTDKLVKHKYSKRRKYFDFVTPNSTQDIIDVFNEWVDIRKDHYFCLVQGHYLKLIDMYPDVKIFMVKYNGKKVGFYGYITDAHNNACITLIKHTFANSNLADAMWADCIERIIDGGTTYINCGDTSDKLKKKLQLMPQKVWYFSQKKLENTNTTEELNEWF